MITGQNPESATLASQKVIEILERNQEQGAGIKSTDPKNITTQTLQGYPT